MPLLPTHRILPDRNQNGHPANVITITAVAGLNANNLQSVVEEININVSENANIITLAYTQANAAYNHSNTAITLGNTQLFLNSTNTSLTGLDSVSSNTFTSTIEQGNSPFIVNSNTVVSNLNADLLDGYNATKSNTVNTVVVRDANGHINIEGINISATDGPKVVLHWNTTDATYDFQLLDGVNLQLGQEQHIYGRAIEDIHNGQTVMFAGAQGDGLLLRVANTKIAGFKPNWIVGVATQNITQSNWGYVTWFGKVHDVDTFNYSLGDVLYVDNTVPGGLTKIEPTAPNYKISVAAVIRVSTSQHSNNGILMIRPDFGYLLNDLHNVNVANTANNDVLVYNSVLSRWENIAQNNLSTGNSDKLEGQHGSYYTDLSNTALSVAQLSFDRANSAWDLANTANSKPTGSTTLDKRHDWVEPYDYLGKALSGSLETSEVWTIKRLTISSNGSITASSTLTNVAWSDRYSIF